MWEIHKRTQQGVSAELEPYIYILHMVHATTNYTCPYVHALFSCLLQGHHIVFMCPDVIFQTLPLCSRPMMLPHVTCHVTMVSYASSLSKKEKKRKEKRKSKIRK